MKMTKIIIALIILIGLFIAGCSQNTPLGTVSTLNDFQKDYFESESSPRYLTYVTGSQQNGTYTDSINETVTMTYGGAVSLAHTDVASILFYHTGDSAAIADGNYTVNYQNGSVTMDEYQNEAVANESMTLTYGTQANFTYRTSGIDTSPAPIVIDQSDLSVVGTGNYSVVYTAAVAGITLTSYRPMKVGMETINCTDDAGGKNVTYNAYGVTTGTVTLMNATNNATIGSGNYTFSYTTGNLRCITSNFNRTNVYINYSANNNTWLTNVSYTYNNASWNTYAIYSWYNKYKINCTPYEIDTGTIDSFVKEIQFLQLGNLGRVTLWIGDYVVNSSDGSGRDVNNIMGKGVYVNNATGLDKITFGKPYYANDEQFALGVIDGPANNATAISFNVVCGYRIR